MSRKFLRFTGVDLETTGLNAEKGDRVTEFAFTIYDFDLETKRFEFRKTFSSLVNPERTIPEKVQRLTSITPAMVASKPTFETFAQTIAKVLMSSDCVIAHNMDFDGPFLHHMITSHGERFNMDCEPYCTMQNGRFATPLGTVPKLEALCWSLGVEFDAEAAHRASYDTEKMMEAFVLGVRNGWFHPECLKGVI